MKASEFIGMKVLDKGAHEIGEVAEMALSLKTCLVDKIFISTGGALNKKYFSVNGEDISAIGDYVQLKLSQEGIEQQVHLDKLKDFLPKDFHFKDLVGKAVLTVKGQEIGRVNDMLVDPEGCLIHNMIISTGSTFSKKNLVISDGDINAIGDYVILNLTKEEVEEMMKG